MSRNHIAYSKRFLLPPLLLASAATISLLAGCGHSGDKASVSSNAPSAPAAAPTTLPPAKPLPAEAAPSEKLATDFLQNVGAGKLDAAKKEYTKASFGAPPDVAINQMVAQFKTHGQITGNTFNYFQAGASAVTLCGVLTFSDNTSYPYTLLENTDEQPEYGKPFGPKQQAALLNNGKWYVTSLDGDIRVSH